MFGKNFLEAINQLVAEKNIDRQIVITTIEAALAAAYRKDYGEPEQNIKVELDDKTGNFKVYDEKNVVKEIDEEMEKRAREYILVADAKKLKGYQKIGGEKEEKEEKGKKTTLKEGDIIRKEITPKEAKFGRIAAQTAKQVIIQRIREAERDAIYTEFKDKKGEVLNATVQRVEGRTVFMDLGSAVGVMYPPDQIRREHYTIGQRYKVFVNEVRTGPKGPEIMVSRTAPGLVKKLFELEVPEIFAKTVEIKALVREAGSRSKMAVTAKDDSVDPIGSCVGQKGTRVQAVKAELGGENIDIIVWDDDEKKFISNALSPAKVVKLNLDSEHKEAVVEVEEDQLSLAIGKEGQNVRLAAKLTGWKIDIAKLGERDGKGKQDKKDKKDKGGEGKEEKKESTKEEKKEKKAEKKDEPKEAKGGKRETKKEEGEKEAEVNKSVDKKEEPEGPEGKE